MGNRLPLTVFFILAPKRPSPISLRIVLLLNLSWKDKRLTHPMTSKATVMYLSCIWKSCFLFSICSHWLCGFGFRGTNVHENKFSGLLVNPLSNEFLFYFDCSLFWLNVFYHIDFFIIWTQMKDYVRVVRSLQLENPIIMFSNPTTFEHNVFKMSGT